MSEEDRYESIHLTIKQRSDGESWFDIIFDYVAGDCEGGGGNCIVAEGDESDCDDHEHEEILPCTCGLETMGGSAGTLEQCFKSETTVGQGLQPIDLARALVALSDEQGDFDNVRKCLKWAEHEIDFEDNWDKSITFETAEEAINWLKDEDDEEKG